MAQTGRTGSYPRSTSTALQAVHRLPDYRRVRRELYCMLQCGCGAIPLTERHGRVRDSHQRLHACGIEPCGTIEALERVGWLGEVQRQHPGPNKRPDIARIAADGSAHRVEG